MMDLSKVHGPATQERSTKERRITKSFVRPLYFQEEVLLARTLVCLIARAILNKYVLGVIIFSLLFNNYYSFILLI
jgi:hypothetical protein